MPTFKPYYGLKKIEYAPAVQNNTDPSSLKQIPFTKVQTAVYANAANTSESVPVEEQSAPIATLISQTGEFTFKWNTYVNDLQMLADLEGGTYTAGTGGQPNTYAPPLKDTPTPVYQYFKFTNLQNGGVKFFNAKVDVVRTGNYQKGALPELEITATAMAVGDTFAPVLEFQPSV